jgi:hypothetical protein
VTITVSPALHRVALAQRAACGQADHGVDARRRVHGRARRLRPDQVGRLHDLADHKAVGVGQHFTAATGGRGGLPAHDDPPHTLRIGPVEAVAMGEGLDGGGVEHHAGPRPLRHHHVARRPGVVEDLAQRHVAIGVDDAGVQHHRRAGEGRGGGGDRQAEAEEGPMDHG